MSEKHYHATIIFWLASDIVTKTSIAPGPLTSLDLCRVSNYYVAFQVEVISALPKLIKLNPMVVKEVFHRLMGGYGMYSGEEERYGMYRIQ